MQNTIKMKKNLPDTLHTRNRLIQMIKVDEPTDQNKGNISPNYNSRLC